MVVGEPFRASDSGGLSHYLFTSAKNRCLTYLSREALRSNRLSDLRVDVAEPFGVPDIYQLEELRQKAGPAQLKECERTYAIFAEKSSAYIKQMERELDGAKTADKAKLLYLLSAQYENRGDAKRANECLDRVQALIEAAAPVQAGDNEKR